MKLSKALSFVGFVLLSGAAACGDSDAGITPTTDAARADAAPAPADSGPVDAARSDAAISDAAPVPDAVPGVPDAIPEPPADAAPDEVPPDAAPPPDAPPALAAHLLITEVALADDEREFIEIYNPTDQTIDLSRYYLADHNHYARLPGAFGNGPTPNLNDSTDPNQQTDFIAQFPAGATIAPREVVVVAMHYLEFGLLYGTAPDFAFDGAPAARAMVDPSSGEFVALGGNLNLSNGGEMVVLFTWDGTSDLVKDVDMVNAGAGITTTSGNRIRPKTTSIDGPDPGNTTSAYQTDVDTIGELAGDAPSGLSHKRIAFETGFEVQVGTGNGVTGDDETSENISMTWDSSFTSATPGTVPQALSP